MPPFSERGHFNLWERGHYYLTLTGNLRRLLLSGELVAFYSIEDIIHR